MARGHFEDHQHAYGRCAHGVGMIDADADMFMNDLFQKSMEARSAVRRIWGARDECQEGGCT